MTAATKVETAQTPSRITYFEVHALHDDRWMIDGAAESKHVALDDATFVLRRPGVAAVRVVKETFDQRTDISASRIIFERRNPVADMLRKRRQASKTAGSQSTMANSPISQESLDKLLAAQSADSGHGWTVFAGLSVAFGFTGALFFVISNVVG